MTSALLRKNSFKLLLTIILGALINAVMRSSRVIDEALHNTEVESFDEYPMRINANQNEVLTFSIEADNTSGRNQQIAVVHRGFNESAHYYENQSSVRKFKRKHSKGKMPRRLKGVLVRRRAVYANVNEADDYYKHASRDGPTRKLLRLRKKRNWTGGLHATHSRVKKREGGAALSSQKRGLGGRYPFFFRKACTFHHCSFTQ